MKPQNIFIIRHGQSMGNVNREVYKTTPDYAVQLTPLGYQQAEEAGKLLRNDMGNSISAKDKVQFYVSPFWRTRQTFLEIQKSFPVVDYYEDPRLREQEWFRMKSHNNKKIQAERDGYGHFYYRFDGGESVSDVFDRMSDFMGTLYRDFEKKDYPNNVVIVTHGMAMRCFIMRFFKCTVEEFESWGNPKNCGYFHLKLQNDGKYKILTPLRSHNIHHKFQFDWKLNSKFSTPKVPIIEK